MSKLSERVNKNELEFQELFDENSSTASSFRRGVFGHSPPLGVLFTDNRLRKLIISDEQDFTTD